MKKKIIIGLVCFIIIVAAYFSYKGYLLYTYRVSLNNEIKEQLDKSIETINVNIKTNLNKEDIMEYKNVIYKKLDGDFIFNQEKSSDNSVFPYNAYYLDGVDSGNDSVIFKAGLTFSAYEVLSSSNWEITTFGFSFKDTNKKELLEKYNLKSDFDIYKYIVNHYDDKVNIFSTEDEIKLNYLIKMYINVGVPATKITLIDGDLKGYMYTINDGLIYEVHLDNEGTNYAFAFWNSETKKYFDISDINEFLSYVQFKD